MGFDLLGMVESVIKVVDLPGNLIGAGCNALGLPPIIGNAIKIGVGAATANPLLIADGAVSAAHDLQNALPAQTSYCPSNMPGVGCQGYAPGFSSGCSPFSGMGMPFPMGPFGPPMGIPGLPPFGPPMGLPGLPPFGLPGLGMPEAPAWLSPLGFGATSPGMNPACPADPCSEEEAVGALLNDTQCQGKQYLTKHDLECFNDDPNASPNLKRAARFFLDHPDAWSRVARSEPNVFVALTRGRVASRSDLQLAAEDIARGRGAAYGATGSCGAACPPGTFNPAPMYGSPGPCGTSGFPYPTWGTGGPSCGRPGLLGGGYGNGALDCILNNPSMSTEEKLEAVLSQLETQADNDLLQSTEALNKSNTALGALSPSDTSEETSKKKAQIQNDMQTLNLQITKLVDRRKNLFDLMTNIHEKFNEMSKLAIQNLGR